MSTEQTAVTVDPNWAMLCLHITRKKPVYWHSARPIAQFQSLYFAYDNASWFHAQKHLVYRNPLSVFASAFDKNDGADCVWLFSLLSHCTCWPWICTPFGLVMHKYSCIAWLCETHNFRLDPCLSETVTLAQLQMGKCFDPIFSACITSLLPYNMLANYRHFR